MRKVFSTIFALITPFFIFADAGLDLPKTPTIPAQKALVDEALLDNSVEKWVSLSESAKAKAFELADAGQLPEATNWLYTHYLADFFSKSAAELPRELKSAILADMPAFFDFYETICDDDSLVNAFPILSTIFLNQPAKCKEFLRAAFALALIYDSPMPAGWPDCKMPENPSQITQAQEVFLYYSLRADKLALDLKNLTVGELIFVMGVGGPLTELEGIFEAGFSPSKIQAVYSSLKIDTKRARRGKSLKWDIDKTPFTLANIKANGGTDAERVYYTWRVANANGVPCLYFSSVIRGETYAWLSYLKSNGMWEIDAFRNPLTKGAYGHPLNPQNWKPVTRFDIKRASLRNKNVYDAIVFSRFAKAFFDAGKYSKARDFAKKAIEANPENTSAYSILIPSLARCGAESAELDEAYKNSISAFSKYPEISTLMLNLYRKNLVARGKAKDADKMFVDAMKPISKNCVGLAVSLYGDVLLDMYSRCKKPNEVMQIYKQILRNAAKTPSEVFDYIVEPTANYFWEKGDKKSAFATLRAFERIAKSADSSISSKFNSLKENFQEQYKAEKEEMQNKGKKKDSADNMNF